MSISKINAALASATNEFTIAAANLNFDFSLVRLEVPKEFSSIGPALSQKRREDAEGGSAHVTARKLGALFEELIPETPNLIRAYGRRASEISASPLVNPRGSKKDGLFQSQVGADGTTLWAAATSGTPAISLHLLACILARLWTGPEAISIWVQIVEERKRQIAKRLEEDAIHFRTLAAARQEVSRQQLAEWDASARAWLRAADAVKERQQQQLLLIVNNVSLAVHNSTDVYTSVIQSWRAAMETLDALVQGMPQQVENGSVLLGLCAWHLYPDMVVLDSKVKSIEMKDNLIAAGGCLTVGLFNDESEQRRGVYWSLSLAHLRFYGDPVTSTRATDSDASRISFDELWIVALGSLLRSWNEDCPDIPTGAKFINTLWNKFEIALYAQEQNAKRLPVRAFRWLDLLAKAALTVLESEGTQNPRSRMLIGLGQRLGAMFLFFKNRPSIPVAFGLTSISNLLSSLDTEGLIGLFRLVASKYPLTGSSAIIRYAGPTRIHDKKAANVFEYASASPIIALPGESSDEEATNVRISNCRWVSLDIWEFCDGIFKTEKLTSVNHESPLRDFEDEKCQPRDFLTLRSDSINEIHWWAPEVDEEIVYTCAFGDPKTAALFVRLKRAQALKVDDFCSQYSVPISELMGLLDKNNVKPTLGRLFENNTNPKRGALSAGLPKSRSKKQKRNREKRNVEPSQNSGIVETNYNAIHLLQRISDVYKLLSGTTLSCNVVTAPLLGRSWIKQAVERLSKALANDKHFWAYCDFHLTRSESFTAIAFFETGDCDIETIVEDVMALSCGSSLYVAAPLLCDPWETPKEYEIRRITGNIGRAGVALLVSAKNLRRKPIEVDNWSIVRHEPFSGEPEDCFTATSLHLSFTGFEVPLNSGTFGNQDIEAYYLETFVSVRDRGIWIADVDILKSLNAKNLHAPPSCKHDGKSKASQADRHRCADNWSEYFDPPPDSELIARAHKNWLARLALTSVAVQIRPDERVLLLPETPCWICVEKVGHDLMIW